ncbi:MAG: hypothetical protein WCI74_17935, partial [Actinomycetes bacterium]
HADWALVREYPLSEKLLALSHVWRSPDGGDYVIAAKGAPEAIADLCHLDGVSSGQPFGWLPTGPSASPPWPRTRAAVPPVAPSPSFGHACCT